MQGWLDAISITDVIVSLAWVGGAAVALKWLKPIMIGLRDITEDWRGRPARHNAPAVLGVMDQLDHLTQSVEAHSASIADIRKQVRPNGGTSAHDAIMCGQEEIRRLVADVMAEVSDMRRVYRVDMRHTHPAYRPEEFQD